VNTSTLSVRRSIVVDAPQALCFETFTDMTSWWPLATHTIGEKPARANIVERRSGGRWYDVDMHGKESDIGRVLAYEPPSRLLLSWTISCIFTIDPSTTTEIEVRFIPETPDRTRIELEHRGFEIYGEGGGEAVKLYEGDGAWTLVLGCYEKHMGSGTT
jgi:uncharacterized protein YndB with AHSA1/START domain